MASEQEGNLPKVIDEKVAELGLEPRNSRGWGLCAAPTAVRRQWPPLPSALEPPLLCQQGAAGTRGWGSRPGPSGPQSKVIGQPRCSPPPQLQRPPTRKSLSGVRFIAFAVGKRQGMNARKMGQFLLNASRQAESAMPPGLPGFRRPQIRWNFSARAGMGSDEQRGETGCSSSLGV